MKKGMKDIPLKLMFSLLKVYMKFIMFDRKESKFKKPKSLELIYKAKLNVLFT